MKVDIECFLSVARKRFHKEIIHDMNECNASCTDDKLEEPVIYTPVDLRQCKAHFRLTPYLTAKLWNELERHYGNWPHRPCLLLDALNFLKCYGTGYEGATFANKDPKTFRKYNWSILRHIADVDWVRLTLSFKLKHK
jgi:hypothetical protein